jgi:hypothetical protein
MLGAAELLADRFDLAPEHAALRDARHKDAAVSALFQQEAIAALLEALVRVSTPTVDMPRPEQRLEVMTVAEVKDLIDATATRAELDRLETLEVAGAQRKTVFAAIDKRRAALAAAASEAEA